MENELIFTGYRSGVGKSKKDYYESKYTEYL